MTQRGVASAVAFVTGHEDPAKPETAIDWPALAALPRDARLLHGRAPAAAHRRAARSPAAAPPTSRRPSSSAARCPTSARCARPLATIADAPRTPASRAPAITVVGPVAGAARRARLARGRGPLAGRTVAVTRARAQASALAARLRALGAGVVEAPAIRIEPLDASSPDLARLRPRCVTSPNGADAAASRRVRDARALAGPADRGDRPGHGARAARRTGSSADVVPSALGRPSRSSRRSRTSPSRRALIARAEEARDVLPDALRDARRRGRRRSRSTGRSPSRSTTRRAPRRWAPTT